MMWPSNEGNRDLSKAWEMACIRCGSKNNLVQINMGDKKMKGLTGHLFACFQHAPEVMNKRVKLEEREENEK